MNERKSHAYICGYLDGLNDNLSKDWLLAADLHEVYLVGYFDGVRVRQEQEDRLTVNEDVV